MRALSVPPPLCLDAVAARLPAAGERVLALDYDGTLAPFRANPAQATPYPGVRERLARLTRSRWTRLAIVSGRALDSLIPLLGLRPLPELFGAHGWERQRPGRGREVAPLSPEQSRLLTEAGERLAAARLLARCEVKPTSLALHWRGLPPLETHEMESQGRRLLSPLAGSGALELRAFDGGIELRAAGRSKATAIEALLAECSPEAFVAYLGDDDTDEDAFAALGERGLGVLVHPDPRESRADGWLRPPEALLAFLDLWLEVSP